MYIKIILSRSVLLLCITGHNKNRTSMALNCTKDPNIVNPMTSIIHPLPQLAFVISIIFPFLPELIISGYLLYIDSLLNL